MIHTPNAHLKVVADSHPGMTGKNNEDRFAVTAFQLSEEDPTPVLFAVLADGIGGHRAGEVAAEMAVNAISEQVAVSDGLHPLETLQQAIQHASQEILQFSQDGSGKEGMGSTCACAWVIGSRLYTSSVGDSRIYLLRGQSIQQLSKDHTWIQDALDLGALKPDQVRGHPNAHVIRRYLGSPTPPQVDQRLYLRPGATDEEAAANQGTALMPNDLLLLCSDGLSDLVNPFEITATLAAQSTENAVQALISLANARGGHDNITLITLKVPGNTVSPASATRSKRRWLWLGCSVLGLAALILLAAALILSGRLIQPDRPITRTSTSVPALIQPLSASPTPPATSPTALSPRVSPTLAATSAPPAAGPTYTPWPTNTLAN